MIIECIYFMIPAYVANMMPVIMRNKLEYLAKPIDSGLEFCGGPILGAHKTWRGLIFGIIGSMLAAYIMYLLQSYTYFAQISVLDYANWELIGFLMGFGALLGDMVKSFFKRRVGIKSGQPWYFVDQIDFPVGSIVLVSLVYFPGWSFAFCSLLTTVVLTVATNHVAYFIGIRKVKW